MIKIASTRDLGQLPRLNILIHGPSGAGKTYLAKTTGDLEHTLVLAAEPGLLTLRDVDIPVAEVNDLEQLGRAWAWLRSGEHSFRWVIVDSISEIAEKCLNEELDKPGRGGKKRHGLEAYGDMGQRMDRNIRRLRDLPLNIVMLAKQGLISDDQGRLARPLLPGNKLTQAVPYLFDEVLALRPFPGEPDEAGRPTVQRWLQTFNDGSFDAKDRSGVLDPFEPPNLAHLAEKILGTTKPMEAQAA